MSHSHHHRTVSDLAASYGWSVEEALGQCRRLGVPIVHGRVDIVLFAQCLHAEPDRAPSSTRIA